MKRALVLICLLALWSALPGVSCGAGKDGIVKSIGKGVSSWWHSHSDDAARFGARFLKYQWRKEQQERERERRKRLRGE